MCQSYSTTPLYQVYDTGIKASYFKNPTHLTFFPSKYFTPLLLFP